MCVTATAKRRRRQAKYDKRYKARGMTRAALAAAQRLKTNR